jgi:hypothetical protein
MKKQKTINDAYKILYLGWLGDGKNKVHRSRGMEQNVVLPVDADIGVSRGMRCTHHSWINDDFCPYFFFLSNPGCGEVLECTGRNKVNTERNISSKLIFFRIDFL